MYNLTVEQIEKAVNWWADAIKMPKFDGLSTEERDDPRNDSYQMAEMLATITAKPKTEQQLDDFKKALRLELLSLDYNPVRGLGVDYGPCVELGRAGEVAGITTSSTAFPWKTTMWFDEDGGVRVRAGYGAPVVEL